MQIYSPAEDSYLLSEVVQKYITKNSKQLKVLDLGTGSGIQAKTCLKAGIKSENILSADINVDALKQLSKLKIKTIESNLFTKIKQKFDLILFNPPYLPKHKYDNQLDTTGGKKGDEIIIKFIKKLKKHLTKQGICFLLTSSHTPEKRFKQEVKKQGLKIRKLATKKIFQEKLYVWKIQINKNSETS